MVVRTSDGVVATNATATSSSYSANTTTSQTTTSNRSVVSSYSPQGSGVTFFREPQNRDEFISLFLELGFAQWQGDNLVFNTQVGGLGSSPIARENIDNWYNGVRTVCWNGLVKDLSSRMIVLDKDETIGVYTTQEQSENETQNITQNITTNNSSSTSANSLAQMLNNSDFLIQGILSGYLTLMKDGQQVSLAGSKEISTVYDKSDDAQAEAEYNAAMAKINRKEKALDNEMKRLDTEHSALQTELESIKSIISDHAGKDFNLFS